MISDTAYNVQLTFNVYRLHSAIVFVSYRLHYTALRSLSVVLIKRLSSPCYCLHIFVNRRCPAVTTID